VVARRVDTDDRRAEPEPLTLPLAEGVPSLGSVRRWAGDALADLGEDDLDDCMLVVTELVSNAYDHGSAPRRVRLLRPAGPCSVRIEVDDASPEQPVMGRSRLGVNRGRGMIIVDRLSRRWGVDRCPDGKTVWAQLACTPPDHARQPA